MSAFAWNVFLALVWVASTGRFWFGNVALGFVLGFAVLWFGQRFFGPSAYVRKVGLFLSFVAFFVRELIEANLRVAYDVTTRSHHMRPGVIAIPLDAETDMEITMLGNLLSLTPGTLALDVSPDRRYLYMHAMYVDDADDLRQRVKAGFERRLLELVR